MIFRRRAATRLGWPVWTRLLGLGLVPLVGMAVVAGPMLSDRLAVADAARETQDQVARLNALFELRFALTEEMIPTETSLRARSFGLDDQQAAAFLGFDLADRRAEARADVDLLLAQQPADDPLMVATRAGVQAVRRQVDGGGGVDQVHADYGTVLRRLEGTADEVLHATAGAAGGSSGTEMHVATDLLAHVTTLIDAGQREREALFRAVVPGADPDPDTARRDLIAQHAAYGAALDELDHELPAAMAEVAGRLRTDPDPVAFSEAVDAAIGASDETLSLLELAGSFRASFGRSELFRELTRATTGHTAAVAADQRAIAVRTLRDGATLMGVLVVVTALAALALAGSITRRLRPLAERARAISEGILVGEPADERGPREVTLVARALNDTVANLRHIEAQANALARGELEDPVLAEPAAGELGASIHRTVHELALAWREGDELQQRLAHQANHDLLTALPNRKAALEALEQALARAHRHGEAVWVLFCDLDGFKRANDTFGHHVGDRILRTCADRLTGCVRAGDVVARLGGDEFVVVTDRLGSAREAAELARRLIDVVSEPIELDGVTTRVGLSVGIGTSLDGRATALDLLRDADNAVHRAKKQGKGRYEVFDERARDELARHNELEQALRAALEQGELRLHYQPVTDTVTGEVKGLEALARWERDGTPVSPAEFIPVAEQSDLINELGQWALRTATQQLADWSAAGRFPDAYVAVNVSGRHLLSPSMVDDVRGALEASGLAPSRLVIEITETVIVTDLVTAVAHLEAVRALGVRVALDDFGTGYTSIGQLWRLPVDVLKIDRSFIGHLETAQDHVIVELMIEVAHTLGLDLVAEGVETTAQQATLRDLRCDAIQGYLIARPQPPEQLTTAPVTG